MIPYSTQAAVVTLVEKTDARNAALGRAVMLAEAIVPERCLGSATAAAVIQKLEGRSDVAERALDSARNLIQSTVEKAKKYLGWGLSKCSSGSVVALHEI